MLSCCASLLYSTLRKRNVWDISHYLTHNENAANIVCCRSRQSFHNSPPRTELNMCRNHTRTQIPIQKRSARRFTRHVLRKVQRRQRSTNPTSMIIHTQLNTARRQIRPMWCFHHMHNLPLQCGLTPTTKAQFVKPSHPKGTGQPRSIFSRCHSSSYCYTVNHLWYIPY